MKNPVKTLWQNKSQILEGAVNTLFKTEDIERVAARRMEVCKACPLVDNEGKSCLIPGTAPCCSECGCKLSFKTRSLSSSCPHPDGSKWTAIIDEAAEDKLYKDINYNPDADV